MIVVVNFGSQSAHLITRRLREISIPSLFVNPGEFTEKTKGIEVKGIILSGGPMSVYDAGSPVIDNDIFDSGIPILGICYGQQYMAHTIFGKVEPAQQKEMGPAVFYRNEDHPLFKMEGGFIPAESVVWMSHTDKVIVLPAGFRTIGKTTVTEHGAIANDEKKLYGVQFHPELVHTQFGMQVLWNFAEICGLQPERQEIDKEFVDEIVADVKDSVGDAKVISALSGGVDSTIATLIVHQAIGNNLTALYIDSGLMRQGETDELRTVFEKTFHVKVEVIDAKEIFLTALKGITDPEKKRKVIGKTFIDVFEAKAQEFGASFLVQGTIWPDVIESAGTQHSEVIKSHHNVGGLPENMKLNLIEPIRNLYKDEVRRIGPILGLNESITQRKPFPGPGLAVRIIGEVTDEKLQILRKADAILLEEIAKWEGHAGSWQAFAVYTGIKSTGVGGDNRSYGDTIAIRSIESQDAMSGNFSHIPHEILDAISTRITNEITEVNRVVYDITNKPPGTIEWE